MTPLGDSGGLPPMAQDMPVQDTPANQAGTAVSTMSLVQPTSTSFLPNSWGKIGTFQIFDETNNGTISASAAAAHGYRYSSVWGARPGLGATWRISNPGLKSSYYFIAVTDMGTGAWGGIGHTLSWWQTYHPSWVLYACTSSGAPTHTPAYIGSMKNVPLDFHNPSVATYQAAAVSKYAKAEGYTALAADEVTYWAAGSGGSGYYPCGIWSGNTFIRRYHSRTGDANYIADIVNWVKTVHNYVKTYYPGLKLIVNHPGYKLNSTETTLLANTDAVMDESGFTNYGRYQTTSTSLFLTETAWMKYAQQHGVSVMINQDWGALAMGAAQIDYSLATYLMGNEQSSAVYISQHTGYGNEVWRSEYATNLGAPCAEYYGGPSYSSTSPSIYYRRFANAVAVVNAGGGRTYTAHLPAGHTYTDLEGRGTIPATISLPSNTGYVLKTTNGCS